MTSLRITWEHVNPFEQLQAIGTLSPVTVACPHDSFLLMIMHSFVLLQDPPLGGDMLLSCWQTTIAPVMTCTTVRDGTPIFEGL